MLRDNDVLDASHTLFHLVLTITLKGEYHPSET